MLLSWANSVFNAFALADDHSYLGQVIIAQSFASQSIHSLLANLTMGHRTGSAEIVLVWDFLPEILAALGVLLIGLILIPLLVIDFDHSLKL